MFVEFLAWRQNLMPIYKYRDLKPSTNHVNLLNHSESDES